MTITRHRIVAVIVATLFLIMTMPFAARSQQDIFVHAASTDSFYAELAEMINSQDDSNYFGKMELTVGRQSLMLDGEVEILDAAPEIVNSRTMLPIRAIAEAAGADVAWEQSTRTVSITSAYGDEINCSIGSDIITVNSETSELDAVPYVKDGRTYLPVRAVSEALEMDVDWDGANQTVTLTAPYQTARIAVKAESISEIGIKAVKELHDGSGWIIAQFANPSEAREAVEILENQGVIAEPDRIIVMGREDPNFTTTSVSGYYSWGGKDCGFDNFVAKYVDLLSNQSCKVAVVDSGVDSGHALLRGKVITGYDLIRGRAAVVDTDGHGTHVAGTIVDCTRGANVQILPIRVIQGERTSYENLANGITKAVEMGADVINLSMGTADAGYHSSRIEDSIKTAIGKGIPVVIAAGNDNSNTIYYCPAELTNPGSIIVSAGDTSHRRSIWRPELNKASNYGKSVDVMAPGTGIISSWLGGKEAECGGTSQATPHVTAAVALLDMATGKTKNAAELEELLHTATTYGKWTNQEVGYGFLDMSKVNIAATSVPSPLKPSVNVQGSNVTVTWNAVTGATGYEVHLVQAPWGANDVKYRKTIPSGTTSCSFSDVAEGYYAAYVISRPNPDTEKSEWTNFSIVVSESFIGVTEKPSVRVLGNSVTVSWKAVADATGYEVQIVQSPWGADDIKYRKSVSKNKTSCTFDNVAEGYYCAYIITRPNDDTVKSEWADFSVAAVEEDFRPVTQKPTVKVSGNSVTVSWEKALGATGYEVQVVQAPWGVDDIKYRTSVSKSKASCTFDNVAEGYYCVYVITRPNDDTEKSDWADFSI